MATSLINDMPDPFSNKSNVHLLFVLMLQLIFFKNMKLSGFLFLKFFTLVITCAFFVECLHSPVKLSNIDVQMFSIELLRFL